MKPEDVQVIVMILAKCCEGENPRCSGNMGKDVLLRMDRNEC